MTIAFSDKKEGGLITFSVTSGKTSGKTGVTLNTSGFCIFHVHITIERSFNFIVPTLIGTSTAVYVVPNHINLVKNDEYGIENHTYIVQF